MTTSWLWDGLGGSQAGASPFGGRLLTADDLAREQASQGGATPKEFTVTKKTDTAGMPADLYALLDVVAVLPWPSDDPLR